MYALWVDNWSAVFSGIESLHSDAGGWLFVPWSNRLGASTRQVIMCDGLLKVFRR